MLKKLDMRWLLPILVLTVIGLFAGCGSEVAKDWDPISPAEARHPFGDGSHADYLAANNDNFAACTECHGANLHGVALGDPSDPVRACTECHRTDHHILFFDNAFEHPQWMMDNEYAMDGCYICHAPFTDSPDSPAIAFGVSCSAAEGCHDTSLGALACNTCHGEMDEDSATPENWAPDQGAHTTHLTSADWHADFTCQVCHTQPSQAVQDGHYNDSTPGVAEVIFHGTAGADGFAPVWSADASTCSDVYCHGGVEVDWRLQNVEFTCASCHTYPPTDGHPASTDCVSCHGAVVEPDGDDADNYVDIKDGNLHINGTLNFN